MYKKYWSLLVVVLLSFWCGITFADVPADPNANPTDALNQFWQAVTDKRWGIAAVIGTMCFVAFARFIAPKVHGKFGAWVNSARVSASFALLSGMLMAMAAQLFKGGKLSMQLVAYGFGIGVAAIGGYNAFWDILFPVDKKQPAPGTTTTGPGPTITKAAMLIPLGLVFLISGCAHVTPGEKAFETSFGGCMEARGITAATSVGTVAYNALTTGTSVSAIELQLEALAGRAGVDVVTCAIQAFLGPPLPTASGAETKLTASALNPAGVAAAQAFLAKHNIRA